METTSEITWRRTNRHIHPELLHFIEEKLSCSCLGDLTEIMRKLGMAGAIAKMENDWMTMADIECYYGSMAYPDSCPPVSYYGGPGKVGPKNTTTFTNMTTPVLYWVIDAIMYQTSIKGHEVLREIGLL